MCRQMRSALLKVRVDYAVPTGDQHTPGSAQLSAAAVHSLRCMKEREERGEGGGEEREREKGGGPLLTRLRTHSHTS